MKLVDLNNFFCQTLKIEELPEGLSMDTNDEWDSLVHLSLMAFLSKMTEGKSDTLSEISKVNSYSALVAELEKNNLLE
jgi:hypothetical protein